MLEPMRTAEALIEDRGRPSPLPVSRSSCPSTTRRRGWLAAFAVTGLSRPVIPFTSVVTVVDNGSTDATSLVAAGLAAELDGVRAVRLTGKGRGRALRAVWSTSSAGWSPTPTSTCRRRSRPFCHWCTPSFGHSDVAIGPVWPTGPVVRARNVS